jgi:hypothetical protein
MSAAAAANTTSWMAASENSPDSTGTGNGWSVGRSIGAGSLHHHVIGGPSQQHAQQQLLYDDRQYYHQRPPYDPFGSATASGRGILVPPPLTAVTDDSEEPDVGDTGGSIDGRGSSAAGEGSAASATALVVGSDRTGSGKQSVNGSGKRFSSSSSSSAAAAGIGSGLYDDSKRSLSSHHHHQQQQQLEYGPSAAGSGLLAAAAVAAASDTLHYYPHFGGMTSPTSGYTIGAAAAAAAQYRGYHHGGVHQQSPTAGQPHHHHQLNHHHPYPPMSTNHYPFGPPGSGAGMVPGPGGYPLSGYPTGPVPPPPPPSAAYMSDFDYASTTALFHSASMFKAAAAASQIRTKSHSSSGKCRMPTTDVVTDRCGHFLEIQMKIRLIVGLFLFSTTCQNSVGFVLRNIK